MIHIRRDPREIRETERKLVAHRARLMKELDMMERLQKRKEELRETKREYNEAKYGKAKALGRKTLSGLARFGSRVGENSNKYYGWKR